VSSAASAAKSLQTEIIDEPIIPHRFHRSCHVTQAACLNIPQRHLTQEQLKRLLRVHAKVAKDTEHLK
jgi:hypothetical protein